MEDGGVQSPVVNGADAPDDDQEERPAQEAVDGDGREPGPQAEDRTPKPKTMIAGGTRLTPASRRVVKLRPRAGSQHRTR